MIDIKAATKLPPSPYSTRVNLFLRDYPRYKNLLQFARRAEQRE